ncbi:MAG: HAMP domain-containing protein [Thermoleophilia bacterium]|nr:HAMP domain-containing protein [Thermoleophilia bacterium]
MKLATIPISSRLAIAFALAMSIVLIGTSTFVYYLQRTSSDAAISANLLQRRQDAVTLVRAAPNGMPTDRALSTGDVAPAQVLDATTGKVLASASVKSARQLVPPITTRATSVEARAVELDRDLKSRGGTKTRVLYGAVPDHPDRVVAVATSLASRHESLESLVKQLLVGAVIALLLGTTLAYWLAHQALRPVERLRRGVQHLAERDEGELLTVPPGSDEIVRLARTMNELLRHRHEWLARERGFVADAGHELRTPLALMSTEIELALENTQTVAEHERVLESLAEETDRLARLANNLLLGASLSDRSRGTAAPPVVLHDLVARIMPRVGITHPDRRLVNDVPADLLVAADIDLVERLVTNLVDNAVQHGAGTVRCSATASNGSITICVSDEGGGFPEAFVERAFDRFSRADDSRSGRGAGLGLAIVRSITATLHGTCGISQTQGETVIWCRLPK